jgi:enoyl-CoA hydratase/carnithine racemase
MEYEQITYAVASGVATITLNRPERLNALTPRMADELIDACDHLDDDDAVRAVVVTGAGRAFCAGADLSGPGHFDRSGLTEAPPTEAGRVAMRFYASRKPLIAAINGHAVGAGITMTLAMDIRLIATPARVGFVFTRRGLVSEAGSTWFLPRLVGPAQAAEWLYTGRLIEAAEAARAGLALGPYEPDQLMAEANRIAGDIATHSAPVAVATTRALLRAMAVGGSPMQAHIAESRAIFALGRTPDAREGVDAFLNKRDPHFTGSVRADLPEIFADPQPSWAPDH